MQDMNYCRFIGTIISDPVHKTTSGGAQLTEFSLLMKGTRWNKDTRQDEVTTEVFGFQAWFTQALECADLAKGDKVSVEAQASRRMIEKDGKKIEKVRFTVFTVTVLKLGNKSTGGQMAADPTEPPPF